MAVRVLARLARTLGLPVGSLFLDRPPEFAQAQSSPGLEAELLALVALSREHVSVAELATTLGRSLTEVAAGLAIHPGPGRAAGCRWRRRRRRRTVPRR